MNKIFKAILALMCFFCSAALCTNIDSVAMTIPVGIRFEKNFYNQWGIHVGYYDCRILQGHLRTGLSWTTSRLSHAFGSNVLGKDNFLVDFAWYFRPQYSLCPYLGFYTGFTRFSREEVAIFEKLDNTAPIFLVNLGVEYSVPNRIISFFGETGYNLISSSTVYPLVFSLGMHFNFGRRQPQ